MKHIWWGMIVLIVVLIAAYVTLLIAGYPRQAHQIAVDIWVPVIVGGFLLTIGMFSGILDDD